MKRITVFCGSSSGTDPIFYEQAKLLGCILARNNIELVYGGAKVGLMGAVADGVLNNGGKAIGVLPHFLKSSEIMHDSLTELMLVETMHERKAKMNELCDGVIALPGGFGTLDEFFEMLTMAQLGLHKKPVALLNVGGFYDPLLLLVDSMVKKGFLKEINRAMILISDTIDDLLEQMKNYQAPQAGKWIMNSGDPDSNHFIMNHSSV
ncbi:MAG TPA: TIGR00730 family Rossman fold protein [Chitinispirillaceae bacterium]|nr:TIGR00730 family Rossman fold protein [Chitinispirillaceae bacterium]